MTRSVYRNADLKRLLAPKSLAIVGASPDTASFGWSTANNLKRFPGPVYLVNPKYKEIEGQRCYPSISALPWVPDCVALTVSRQIVEPVVLECAERGVGGVVVFASGYTETGKPERIAQQQRLAEIARSTGLRIIGPNCIGVVNYVAPLILTFTRGATVAKPGPVSIGIATQSGAMGNAVAQAAYMGLPFSHLLAAGNSCDVDTADYVAYLAEDPDCNVIVCIFEGVPDPSRLIEAAEIAKANDKPLIIYKAASGEGGAAAALSHTGILAGSHAAYTAAFERMEAIVVDEFEAIAETAEFFAKAKHPKARGVGVAAGSGGMCVMAVDIAHETGVPLAPPNESVRAALRPLVPEFGVIGNPCDATAANTSETWFHVTAAFLADDAYGAMVLPHGFTTDDPTKIRRVMGMHEAAKLHDKIACLVWMTAWHGGPGMKEAASASHLTVFTSMRRCFNTLTAWHKREDQIAARASLRSSDRASDGQSAATAAQALAAHSGRIVPERAAKKILSGYGVPVTQERLVQSAAEAVAVATELGYPVVLKVESEDLPHKTESGVVRLSLANEAAVSKAYGEIMDKAQAISPKPRINGVLVQPMITGNLELMIGTKTDPQFGPLIVVGLGGIFVELLKNAAVDLAPVSPAQALAMLQRLKGSQVLDGFRGAPPVDRKALADIISRVSEFAADQRELVAELDINPLICWERGIVAVDALIVKHAG